MKKLINWRTAALIIIGTAALFLLGIIPSEDMELTQFVAILFGSKIAACLLMYVLAELANKWASVIGIDNLLND